ncbi:MAG: TetR/AcrR family transcriptional regulator C-terminal domain-containing protein, partial [Pseudomonadota bacterium]
DGDTSDLRSTLIRFAKAFRATALSPEGIAMFRTMMSEAQRFPTLARAVYAVGPGQTLRQLSAHIEKAMQSGQLRSDDADFASELLLGMLTGMDRTRYLFGVKNPESTSSAADEIKTTRIIDSFLRAYAPLLE